MCKHSRWDMRNKKLRGVRMNYWKLGCNWGRGMPDFYSLLKEKRIVICGGHPMEKGDWVLICQGHDAVALARIGATPVPSSSRADLQADFERLQLNLSEKEWHFH